VTILPGENSVHYQSGWEIDVLKKNRDNRAIWRALADMCGGGLKPCPPKCFLHTHSHTHTNKT
jgi:hypothetical protein